MKYDDLPEALKATVDRAVLFIMTRYKTDDERRAAAQHMVDTVTAEIEAEIDKDN